MTARRPSRRRIALLSTMVVATLELHGSPLTGRQFFHVTNFDTFELELLQTQEVRLTSPTIDAGFDFNQLVVSWNVSLAPRARLKIEVQPVFARRTGRFYTLGWWSAKDAVELSHSVPSQSDRDAEVETDVLVLAESARKFRVRLTLIQSPTADPTILRFLGVSVLNNSTTPSATVIMPGPRGAVLPVPTRSQLDYPMGDAWCSPTSLSMVLSYWAALLDRADLDRDVPEVAAGVDDPGWPGTGNWPFNAAYAGSFPGMRAYVTRLGDVGELEYWIDAGVPVVASVAYSLLKGEPNQNDGHLVVVVGFDPQGAVILNDPGTRHSVQKTVPRDQFATAWSHSHNTVYLVHPVDHAVPASPDGHW